MGCVKTSKVGTEYAVIKADPMVYLGQFGKQINEAQLFDILLLAEHCLVKVLDKGTSCTPMDHNHYWQYHHSKNKENPAATNNIAGNKTSLARISFCAYVDRVCEYGV